MDGAAALLVMLALGLGALGGWLWGARRGRKLELELTQERARAQAAAADSTRLAAQAAEAAALREQLAAERRATQVRDEVEARARAERAEAESRARAEREAWLTAQMNALADRFGQLSDTALERAQGRLVAQADETLKLHRSESDRLLQPIREQLQRYEENLKRLETDRRRTEGGLETLLKQLSEEVPRTRAATQLLTTALRSSSRVAGRWGEEQCRNVLEQAGLVEGVDFETQVHQTGETGRQLPDFILKLPGERRLVVDVKCSVDAFLAAAEAEDDAVRRAHLADHAQRLRGHALALARKDYAAIGQGTVDFVIMFVGGENFLAAAVAEDPRLMHEAFERRVVPAGPINLIAVARTVAAIRSEARLQEQAHEIAVAGAQLHETLRTMTGHFGRTGQALETAVKRFNEMVGSFDARVIPAARRMADHGVRTREALAAPPAIDLVPRETRHRLADGQAPQPEG